LVLERITDQPHHPLRLRIRIEMIITVRAPHLSHGRMMQQGTALGLVAPPLMHAACEKRPFGFVHHAPQPQQEAISIIRWIIQTIGLGQQGAKDRTAFEELMPVCVRACQATQRQPQHQPNRVSADLGQQALKAQARGDTLAALALILIHHDHPFGGPPPSDGALDQGLWPGCGRDVLHHVLRMRLADRHDRLSAQMMVAEFRPEATDSAWMASGLNHEAPPSASTGGAGR
jgi:hypothetical protein